MHASQVPLVVGVSLTLAACLPPSTLLVYSKDEFRLGSLHDAQVAILPVTEAVLDDDTAETVVGEYGSKEKFLEVLSAKVSGAILKICREPSLDASAVRGLLESSPDAATLLEPGAAIGDPASPGATPTAGRGLADLARMEMMQGVQYALVLRRVSLARKVNSTGALAFPAQGPSPMSTGSWMQPMPPGPATVVGATVLPGGGVVGGSVISPSGAIGGMVVGGTAVGGVPMAGGYTAGATVVGGTLIGASMPGSMSGGMGTVPFNSGPSGAGGRSQLTTNARLEWAVVDLQSGEVIWVGQSGTSATSMFMKATALHEVEEQLAEVLATELSKASAVEWHSRGAP
jgi:hypothetical protein